MTAAVLFAIAGGFAAGWAVGRGRGMNAERLRAAARHNRITRGRRTDTHGRPDRHRLVAGALRADADWQEYMHGGRP